MDNNHNAVEGQQITAAVNDPDAGSGITYTWTVGGQTVQGDSGNTYTPTEADEGKTITVSASFTDSDGNVETPSASAGTAVRAGPVSDSRAVSGSGAVPGSAARSGSGPVTAPPGRRPQASGQRPAGGRPG